MVQLKKKDILYYARILPGVRIYEVCEMEVRTVTDTWFVAIDKRDKRAYLFSYNNFEKTLFFNREDALAKVNEAEDKAGEFTSEILYERY